VKTGAVVKSFFGERLEILDGLGRGVGPKFDDHGSFGGGDDGDFVRCAHGRCGGCIGFGFFGIDGGNGKKAERAD
jgi:hypothetical protein